MKQIVAVTGHRPTKVAAYPECYQKPVFEAMVGLFEDWLDRNADKVDKVITGMALMFDQAVAQACVNKNVPFIAAVPFKGQESQWPGPAQIYYHELLSKAAEVVYVSQPPYHKHKMMVRNAWMMKRGDRIVALWDRSESGGTWSAVQYARSIGKEPENIWDEWLKVRAAMPSVVDPRAEAL